MEFLGSCSKISLIASLVFHVGRGIERPVPQSSYRPGLRVLYTTGSSRNAIVHQGRLDPGVNLISKPFTFEQLAARIRDVLDRC